MTWNCAMFDFTRNEYKRHHVYGHVRAQRCYQSRKTNGVWDIPYTGQERGVYPQQLPPNLQHMAKCAINNGGFDFTKVTKKYAYGNIRSNVTHA